MTPEVDRTPPPSSSRYRPWIAAGLSVLIPGAGHLYLRRYLRAVLWASPMVLIVAAYLLLDIDKFDLLRAAVSKPALWGIFAGNVLASLWRLAGAYDAYTLAMDTGRRRLGPAVAAGGLVLVAFVAVPHIVVATTTLHAMRLFDIVFVSSDEPLAAPVTPIEADDDQVADPVLETYDIVNTYDDDERIEMMMRSPIFQEGFGDPDAIAALREYLELTQRELVDGQLVPLEDRVGADRITFLLVGIDSGAGRGTMLTDTMIVATINPKTGKAALFGFSRELGSMPLPPGWGSAFSSLEQDRHARTTSPPSTTAPTPPPSDGGTEGEGGEETTTTTATTTTAPPPPPSSYQPCRCFPEKLNEVYPRTRGWTKTYPNEVDPGLAALRDVLSNAMGLRIDYYARVDMAAFVDIVEAIGGVDVYVQQPLKAEVSPPREGEPWAIVDVGVGWHHLDGREALAYVRERRKSGGDYGRMQRQRCLLRAVAAKSTPLTLLRGLGAIVDALDGSLVTDLPVSFAADMIEMAARLDFSDVVTVGIQPSYYAPGYDVLGHPVPDLDRIRGKVASVIKDQDAGVRADASGEPSECDP